MSDLAASRAFSLSPYQGERAQSDGSWEEIAVPQVLRIMDDASLQTTQQSIPLSYSRPAERTYILRWITWTLIIGVISLISLALIAPGLSRRSYDLRSAAADISAMSTAMDTFKGEVGRYPTTAEGLAALSVAPPGLTSWQGPYVGKPMFNDPWGRRYNYISPGVHNPDSFDLLSAGANGKSSDVDDITNW